MDRGDSGDATFSTGDVLPAASPAPVQKGALVRSIARGLLHRWQVAPPILLWGWIACVSMCLTLLAWAGRLHLIYIPCAALLVLLSFWSRRTQDVMRGATPFLAQGVAYEVTSLTWKMSGARVHVAALYLLERDWFGIRTVEGVLTLNQLFARHHWAPVDLVTGGAYILYIYEVAVFFVFLGLTRRKPGRALLLRRFGWAFFGMSLAGFMIYHLYPVAPPWYVSTHGFALPSSTIAASPAAAVRWDALTGIPYYRYFYRFTSDPFGAFPSLHVAYALVVFLYATALRKRWLSMLLFVLYGLMCFSAVYLQHHYVIDVLAGSLLALASWTIERSLTAFWRKRTLVPT